MNGWPPTDGIGALARKIIASTPTGAAALQANDLAKKSKAYQRAGNPHAAASAALLAKAKKGDKNSQSKIKLIKSRASQGDPKAAKTMRAMRILEKNSKGFIWDRLYHEGLK